MRDQLILTLAAAAAAACSAPALAIIAPFGTMPKPEAGHVGWIGGGSAVPISDSLLLTAKHVHARPGQPLSIGGSWYRVATVANHPTADLSLISVSSTMPSWHELTFDAAAGDTITLGGTGVLGQRKGKALFTWTDQRQEQWAQNSIDSATDQYLTFDLDRKKPGVAFEGIVTPGDSGSGVFLSGIDGSLTLAGITVGVSGPAGAAKFGSIGYAVNLATYSDFILSAAARTGFTGTIAGHAIAPVPAPSAAAALGGVLIPFALRRRRTAD